MRDSKGRLLLSTEDAGGKLKIVFGRYQDMSDDDKKVIREVFSSLKKAGASLADHDGKEIGDIESFLSFKETDQDLCG